jgi:GT2 family glycosyltransferase
LSLEPATRLACVLLNYKNVDDTEACLESLRASAETGSGARPKIFLVNNHAEDASGPRLRAALSASGFDHAYLEPGFNAGFAGGSNVGMRAALSEGFTHVMLLNNDTIVAADFLRKTERAVRAFPLDVIAGDVTDMEGRPTHNVGTLSPWTGRVRHALGAPAGEIDFVSGCLMIVPREAIESAGFFDERLFMYCEDMDLCMRLSDAGFRVRYAPGIRVRHRFHPLTTHSGLPKEYYIQRNQAYVILRRGTLRQRMLHLCYLAAMPLYKAARRPEHFIQAVRGACDGILGRMGMRHVPSDGGGRTAVS